MLLSPAAYQRFTLHAVLTTMQLTYNLSTVTK